MAKLWLCIFAAFVSNHYVNAYVDQYIFNSEFGTELVVKVCQMDMFMQRKSIPSIESGAWMLLVFEMGWNA